MPGRRRAIGRSPKAGPARARRAAVSPSVHSSCRFCRAQVMWLEHVETHKLAPIDHDPAPGGNVIVHRGAKGELLGTYSVIGKDEGTLFDTTVANPDARPSLHLNHWATCNSPTARRLARERRGGRSKLVTADGDPIVGDPAAPPPEVLAAHGHCTVCGGALDPVLAASEPQSTTHPGCEPLPPATDERTRW